MKNDILLLSTKQKKLMQLVLHPVKFRLFLLKQLPAAFFSGLKVQSFNQHTAVVSVPYRWATKNPFNSTYFACLAMAAEMSTGLLAMIHTYKTVPAISMLVTGLEATYIKKATGLTLFTCEEGKLLQTAIDTAISTGNGCAAKIKSTGKNEVGEIIAEFVIEWRFKVKHR